MYICSYCRGIKHTDLDGTESIKIEHGVKRMAHMCSCECHADQVVVRTSFDITMTVTLDVLEAFMRWCEENEYTQADFDPEGMGDDVYGDGEAFAEWWAKDLMDDCTGEISGTGVLSYGSEVDGYDFDPLAGVDYEKLMRIGIPMLPPDPDSLPVDGADLGMEPLFAREDVEGA